MVKDSFASLMEGAKGGADRAKRKLKVGEVMEAPVLQITGEYVYVDVGTPSDGRIPRIELADERGRLSIAPGDRIRVSVVDPRPDGPTLKAVGPAAAAASGLPQADEVLKAKVTRIEKFGLFVSTPKGDGLVPLRELALPPGSDHRRLFPVGREFDVVLLEIADSGKLKFSATRVAQVEEQKNYRDFSKSPAPQKETGSLGSLGDVLRQKLGAPESQPRGPAPGAPNVVRRKK